MSSPARKTMVAVPTCVVTPPPPTTTTTIRHLTARRRRRAPTAPVPPVTFYTRTNARARTLTSARLKTMLGRLVVRLVITSPAPSCAAARPATNSRRTDGDARSLVSCCKDIGPRFCTCKAILGRAQPGLLRYFNCCLVVMLE